MGGKTTTKISIQESKTTSRFCLSMATTTPRNLFSYIFSLFNLPYVFSFEFHSLIFSCLVSGVDFFAWFVQLISNFSIQKQLANSWCSSRSEASEQASLTLVTAMGKSMIFPIKSKIRDVLFSFYFLSSSSFS